MTNNGRTVKWWPCLTYTCLPLIKARVCDTGLAGAGTGNTFRLHVVPRDVLWARAGPIFGEFRHVHRDSHWAGHSWGKNRLAFMPSVAGGMASQITVSSFLKNNFSEIQFRHHTIFPFEVCNSMVSYSQSCVSATTTWEHFIIPNRSPTSLTCSLPLFFYPAPS